MAYAGQGWFDDLDTDPMADAAYPAVALRDEAIRKAAHIANGGEATFSCPKCNGTGRFGRYGQCFKCDGSGKVSKRVAAAAKGMQTRAANLAEAKEAFLAEHGALITGLREIASWHNFAASLIEQFDDRGSLSDRQIEAGRGALARVAERREQKRREANAQAAEKSGTVGVDAINALFATAIGNGLKKPIFRTERLTIKPAKKYADTLYVTDRALGGEYVGKIVNGRFLARREAQPDTLNLLCTIASDPMKAAVEYGRSTGSCGCCGRELTDPISVANGIGPICQERWGL